MKRPNTDIALDFAKYTKASFFLTGRAGTGKSTLLRKIINESNRNTVVLAPTGIAALNVNGTTIHSFFQFPHRTLFLRDKRIKPFWANSEKRKLIESLDTVIIDEVSMVRADVMDAIDHALRINSKYPQLPFGGKQMIFIGDLYQLEPITKEKNEEMYIKEVYGYPYFFQAKALKDFKLITIELNQVFRQRDKTFIDLLDKVRTGTFDENDLRTLNSRVQETPVNNILTLTTRVDIAEKINKEQLQYLSGQIYSYEAEVSGNFDDSASPVGKTLQLKVNAQVMFIKNDKDGRWVNGTLGYVHDLTSSSIHIQLANGNIYEVNREIWDNVKYKLNPATKKVETQRVGAYKQYPLKPAWAVTIHKSQGMTFNSLIIDFGTGTFANGQAYVALSRVTSFQGLYLKRPLTELDIQVDEALKSMIHPFNHIDFDSELARAKKEYALLEDKSFLERGDYYLRKALNFVINKDYKNAFQEFRAVFAVLPDGYISRDGKLNELLLEAFRITSSIIGLESTSQFYFVLGILKLFRKDYNGASEAFSKNMDHEDALSLYFLSKSLYLNQSPLEALDAIDKSLEILPTTRSYYHKAMIHNPYTNCIHKDGVINKNLHIENLLLSLNLDSRNLNAYKALLYFLQQEGILIEMPDQTVYLNEIRNSDLNNDFTRKIQRLIQKNKFKLLNAALSHEEEDLASFHELRENEPEDGLGFEISEQELMEDSLDEYLNSEEYY